MGDVRQAAAQPVKVLGKEIGQQLDQQVTQQQLQEDGAGHQRDAQGQAEADAGDGMQHTDREAHQRQQRDGEEDARTVEFFRPAMQGREVNLPVKATDGDERGQAVPGGRALHAG